MKWLSRIIILLIIVGICAGAYYIVSMHKVLNKEVKLSRMDDPQLTAKLDQEKKEVGFLLGSDGKVYWNAFDLPKVEPKKKGWFGRD